METCMTSVASNSGSALPKGSSSTKDLMSLSLEGFIDYLKEKSIERFFIITDPKTGELKSSHKELQSVLEFSKQDQRDFDSHEALFFMRPKRYDALFGAFIHRTNRGQGHGGARFWSYPSFESFYRDGLRLSQGMTHKNSLAYLWWGGGKGIIAQTSRFDKDDPEVRDYLFQEYGKFLSSLQGCYYSAEDVGVREADLRSMFKTTRFMTCIPAELGGSGNPSLRTAQGVLKAMQAAGDFLGWKGVEGKKVVIQGLGNVGFNLTQFLFEAKVGQVIASDISEKSVRAAESKFSGQNFEARLSQLSDNSILEEDCDILAPCATGAVINEKNIPSLRTKVLCGGANNILEDPSRDDRLLFERGIVYVPDFLANRMGIVNCSNEQYGYVDPDPEMQKHLSFDWEHSVYQTSLRVLKEAKEKSLPTAQIAIKQANELSKEMHPIYEHRGQKIITSLVESNWARA